METISVKQLLENIDPVKHYNRYRNTYVKIKGYLHNGRLFNSEDDYTSESKTFVKLGHQSHSGILRNIFQKQDFSEMVGTIEMVCKIEQQIRTEIGFIVAAKLFDPNGNEVSFSCLKGNDVPIELRDII